jgi:hypothetical protein
MNTIILILAVAICLLPCCLVWYINLGGLLTLARRNLKTAREITKPENTTI